MPPPPPILTLLSVISDKKHQLLGYALVLETTCRDRAAAVDSFSLTHTYTDTHTHTRTPLWWWCNLYSSLSSKVFLLNVYAGQGGVTATCCVHFSFNRKLNPGHLVHQTASDVYFRPPCTRGYLADFLNCFWSNTFTALFEYDNVLVWNKG